MDTPWLEGLEAEVEAAAEELARLRKENRELTEKVERLQRKRPAPASEETAGWAAERDEIRQRVERLVSRLGKLLDG